MQSFYHDHPKGLWRQGGILCVAQLAPAFGNYGDLDISGISDDFVPMARIPAQEELCNPVLAYNLCQELRCIRPFNSGAFDLEVSCKTDMPIQSFALVRRQFVP